MHQCQARLEDRPKLHDNTKGRKTFVARYVNTTIS